MSVKSKKKALIKEEILDFFRNFDKKDCSREDIRKIKRKSMSINFKLGNLRKKFCQDCYNKFNVKNSETRVKNKIKIIKCLNCNKISRWKIK